MKRLFKKSAVALAIACALSVGVPSHSLAEKADDTTAKGSQDWAFMSTFKCDQPTVDECSVQAAANTADYVCRATGYTDTSLKWSVKLTAESGPENISLSGSGADFVPMTSTGDASLLLGGSGQLYMTIERQGVDGKMEKLATDQLLQGYVVASPAANKFSVFSWTFAGEDSNDSDFQDLVLNVTCVPAG